MLGERVKGKIENLDVETVFIPREDGIGQLFGGMNIHFEILWNAGGVETLQSVMLTVPYAISGEKAQTLAQAFADSIPYGDPVPEEIESYTISDPAFTFRCMGSLAEIEEYLTSRVTRP